eukprot:gene12245-13506_t
MEMRNPSTGSRQVDSRCSNPEKKYGWFGVYFSVLQFLNRPMVFLICMCILMGTQGMIITGVTSVIVTTIQTRFGFTSVQAGALSSSYDTAYGVSSIFVSFFGHTRKPFLLGVGSIILAIGCFTASVPNYIIGKYHAGVVTDIDWCNNTLSTTANAPTECTNVEWYYLAIFCAAYAIMGLGATPIYILGPSHIDASTMPGQNGVYLGTLYVFGTIGTSVGFLIGKPMLNTYVDIVQPPGSNLTPSDKIWVGAWWMGYLLGTGLFLLICIPMLGFPQEFASTEDVRAAKRELEDTIQDDGQMELNFKTLISASKSLLQNKPYMFLTLAITSEAVVVGGFATFIPKFFESQFFLSASNAALYSGAIFVPGVGGGIIFGGLLLKKFQWNCQTTLKMIIVFSILGLISSTSVFIGCGTKDIAGINVAYKGQKTFGSIDGTCRSNCTCSHTYMPICTQDNQQMYYSACHAGCTRDNQRNSTYHGCSCFPDDVITAVEGSCYGTCDLLYLFMPCFFLTLFITFLNNVPMVNATFRVVPESQSSYAMGFQQVFVRFLGFIPGPIVFGKLVDKACILWQVDTCGENRNCLEYNNDEFRYYLAMVGASFKLVSLILLILAYYSYTPPIHKAPSQTTQDTYVIPNVEIAIPESNRGQNAVDPKVA